MKRFCLRGREINLISVTEGTKKSPKLFWLYGVCEIRHNRLRVVISRFRLMLTYMESGIAALPGGGERGSSSSPVHSSLSSVTEHQRQTAEEPVKYVLTYTSRNREDTYNFLLSVGNGAKP